VSVIVLALFYARYLVKTTKEEQPAQGIEESNDTDAEQ